ncbi:MULTISPECIES: ComGF family competence protein [unclassified Lactobacillus]|uniref:ComGF family competence protein n=1 Tax=unclassified Lactobacillus TaxID=2620435 RepID=UPI001313ED59|nr:MULTISPECIES: ComGF family competence protein [unclassified Lactobacillus]
MLAEAVFSVIVTLLVVLTLQNLIKTVTVSNRMFHKTDDVVFAYVQLNRFLHEDKVKAAYTLPEISNSRQGAFVKVDEDGQKKTYLVSQYKNMIRVTTSEGGHMPLLLNIKRANFHTKDCLMEIHITEKDNRNSDLIFKFGAQPKKREKNEFSKKKKIKIES